MEVITLEKIKDKIVRRYIGKHLKNYDDTMSRKLNIASTKNYNEVGDVLFSLEGSPAIGRAIYTRESSWTLTFLTCQNEVFDKLYSVRVKEVEEEIKLEKEKQRKMQ